MNRLSTFGFRLSAVCLLLSAFCLPPSAFGQGARAGAKSKMAAQAGLTAGAQAPIGAALASSVYDFEVIRCTDGPAGKRTPQSDPQHCRVAWRERVRNTVVTEGLNDALTKYFKGSSYTAAWYVGLKNTGTVDPADTAASHSGWTENQTYSQATRPALTLGTASAGSINNSASKAAFSINGSTTIYGAFVISDNTKGGTSGVLYGAVNFGASRAVLDGDTLNVTVTLSIASA